MPDVDGKFLVKRQSQFKSARGALNQHCQEIAELVLPMMSTFFGNNYRIEGEKRTQQLMEGTSPLALERYASVVTGSLVPRAERWAKLSTNDRSLNRKGRVKQYFDEANDALFQRRYDPQSGFSGAVHECMMGVGAFGTTATYVDQRLKRGINRPIAGLAYTPIALQQLYGSQGPNGHWDTVHRAWKWSARNIEATFPENVPADVQTALATEPDREFDMLHCVVPNADYVPQALGPRGMPYASYYVFPDTGDVLSRGGYRSLRYAIARGLKGAGEHYGRSPAMTILAEIKSLNEMRRGLLRAQHMTLTPPSLLAGEQGANLKLRPGAQNFGMVSQDGKPLAIPYQMGNTFPPTEREMERIRSLINDAFLLTLFQILIERSQQTATETLQRAKEQATILIPLIGRLQDEYLGSIIESELTILSDLGELPPMPPELVEAQGEYTVTYSSDLMRALQAGDVDAYRLWLQDAAPIAERKPEVLEVVDHEAILAEAAEKRGIPVRHIRTPEQLKGIKDSMAQADAEADALPAAQQVAGIERERAETARAKRAA